MKFNLTGPFPLGSNKGTAEIVSPQLAEPVPLSFEVKARRPRWLIAFFLALGLVAGYLIRTKLQQQIELDEARLKGWELHRTIRDMEQKHADQVFKTKLQQILTDLEGVLIKQTFSDLLEPKKRAENLNTAVTKVKTDFGTAQTDLQTSLLNTTRIRIPKSNSVRVDPKSEVAIIACDVPCSKSAQLDESNSAAKLVWITLVFWP